MISNLNSAAAPAATVKGAAGVNDTPSELIRSSRTDSAVDASVGCVLITLTVKLSFCG